MIALVPLLLAPTLSLHRGCDIGSSEFRYWAVEDTFLTPTAPTENYGRDFLLSGGAKQTILIKFGDLHRATGGRPITEGSLVLHQEIGNPPVLRGIYRLERRWGEGPGRRGDVNNMGSGDTSRINPPTAATFKERMAGSHGWSIPGALGGGDSKAIDGVKAESKDGVLTLTGLAAALEDQRNHPDRNFGFALVFDQPCDFDSSDAPSPAVRPRLDLTLGEAQKAGYDWIVSSRKDGDQLVVSLQSKGASPATTAQWLINDRIVTQLSIPALKDGETRTFSTTLPAASSDPQATTVTFQVDGIDADPENSSLTHYVGAPYEVSDFSPDTLASHARFLNETLLPQSRFSFAMAGVPKRFNWGTGGTRAVVLPLRQAMIGWLAKLGIPQGATAARFPGLMGAGDTSDESGMLRGLSRQYEPWSDPVIDDVPLFPTDLLSASEAAVLMGLDKVPPTVFLRLTTQAAQPLFKAKVMVGDKEFETSERGLVQLDSSLLSMVSPTPIKVKGMPDGAEIWPWQLIEGTARSGKRPVMLQYAVPYSELVLDETSNVLLGKPIQLLKGDTPPYELVDGKPQTTAPLPPAPNWVEVDTGRDRLLGAVEIIAPGAIPSGQLDVFVRETGEDAEERRIFARAFDLAWAGKALAKNGAIRLYGLPSQARYVRFVWRGKEPLTLSEVRVITGKRPQ